MIKIYQKYKTASVQPHRDGAVRSVSINQLIDTLGLVGRAFVRRKIMLFSTIVLIITIPILYLVIKYRSPIEAAWYDDTYAYRQTVAITNAGTAQTDFQVAITLNTSALVTAGKMQSDCDDIRITDVSGKVLPHWIETGTNACNTATTAIWTKVPSISTTGTTVYLYYGNPSAASTQNGGNVFAFFDDFSGSSFDSSKWSTTGTNSITSGVASSGGTNNSNYFSSVSTFSSGIVAEFKYKSTGGYGRFGLETPVTAIMHNSGGASALIAVQSDGSTGLYTDIIGPSANAENDDGNTDINFHTMQIHWNSDSVKWVYDGSTLRNTTISTYIPTAAMYLKSADLTQVDYVFVRKYATTYPSVAAPTNEEKSTGPVAYWKFDEGYGDTTYDSIQNANNGTRSGTTKPTWQSEDQCISGKCLYFDGTTSFINAGNKSNINITSAITISSWVKYGSMATSRDVVNHTGCNGYMLYAIGGTDIAMAQQCNGDTLSAGVNLYDNKWHFVVGTYDGTTARVYVDGVQKNSGNKTWTFSNTGNLSIGRAGDLNQEYFKGFMDDFKIYPYARTAAQIKSDFASKGSGSAKGSSVQMGTNVKNSDAFSNGLVGYWKLDESSTPSVDSSGNGNSGTWAGNAAAAAGKFGNGISLDGTGDWVSIGSVATYNLAGGNFTLCSWFKTSGTEEDIAANGVGGDGLWLLMSYQNKLRGHVWYSGNSSTIDSNATVNNNAWRHGCQVVDDTKIYLYIDGVLDNSQNLSGTKSGTTGTTIIGSRSAASAGNNFAGSIDDVRIYNRALSPKEVRDLYNWAPGPVGYWNMDEGVGTSLNDKSGNGLNSSSLTGTVTWSQGKFGKSLYFNKNLYADMGNPSLIDSLKQFTVDAWIKLDSLTTTPANEVFISKVNGSCAGNGWRVEQNSAVVSLTCGTVPGVSITIPDTNWHHIAFTVSNNGTNFSSVSYLDGVQKSTNSAAAASLSNAFNLYFGDYTAGGSPYNYKGKLDEIRIYNYARTSKQIVEDMNAGHPAPGSPVGSAVGYWKMDEGYGTTANDSGPNNLGLSLVNSASWTNSGKFNKALSLNGASQRQGAQRADNDALDPGTSSFTTSAWIKTTQTGSAKRIVTKRGSSSTWYSMYIHSNKLTFETAVSYPTYYTSSSGSTTINDGSWHYVAMVRDTNRSKVILYVDGKQDLSTTDNTAGQSIANSEIFEVGIWGTEVYDSGSFTGQIDEVKIYNSALTEDEIKLDYNHGSAMVLGESVENRDRVTSGQTLYLDATDKTSYPGTGTAWYDRSGNGYNATLSSPTWNGLKFTNTSATLTNLGSSVYPNISTNTTILWVYPELGGGAVWSVTDQDGHTYMTYVTGGDAYINTWETGGYTQRTVWNATESVPHQIVITKNGSVRTVYDNLVQKGQVTITNIATSVNTNLVFGSASQPMGLSIVETYNRVLSMDEITQDYYAHAYKFNINAEPVAEWKMDEKTGGYAYDTSGNGNTGTLTNSPSWTSGKIGSAIDFSGATNKYVNVTPSGTTLDLTSPGTLEAWVYSNSFDSWDIIIARGNWAGGLNNYSLYYQSSSNQIIGEIANASTVNRSYIASASTALLNGWHHITFTWDGSYTRIYLDGKLSETARAQTINAAPSGNLGIGGISGGYAYNGKIDHARVFNYARTPAQIAYDYNRGGPITWWKMDECQGGTAYDSSGFNNNGSVGIGTTAPQTALGTCTSGNSTDAWYNGRNGKYNSSLNFDGQDDQVTTTISNIGFQTIHGPSSISLWFNVSALSGTRYIFSDNCNEWGIYHNGTTLYGIAYAAVSAGTISTGQWYHVVLTHDHPNGLTNTLIKVYLNGIYKGQNTWTYSTENGYTDSPYYIGDDNCYADRNFAGQIDDVKIFNYALTANQVKSLYNAGAAVQFAPLTGSP